MVNKKSFIAGFLCCSILMACADTFPFKYYEYDIKNGKLLGATAQDDLPDSQCNATPASAYPCMIVLTDEFFKLKADDLKAHQDLQDCQSGNPPNP